MINLSKTINTVIFDIDGTLTETISWLEITKQLGASVEEHKKLFKKMKTSQITTSDAIKNLIKLWRATNNANRQNFKQIFQNYKLRDDSLDTINYLKEKYKICIISSSIKLYVKTIATKLKIKDYYGNTELIWDENDLLVDLDYHPNQATKKVKQLKKFIKQNNLTKDNCVVIGDGDSDIELFKYLTHSIAIITEVSDGHIELQQLAEQKIKDLSELKSIL